MSNPRIRIGYVPEHFASPLLQLAAQDSGVELVSCPSGTGQILSAFKAGEIDVSIALTEALIAGIAKKTADYKIVGTYVTSPLNWAVIVGKETAYQNLADLKGETIGISRLGSGSQIMASYMALQQGWVDQNGNVEPIHFQVLDSFKNLRDGVNNGGCSVFMWEHFTTKPYLSEVRFIDHVLTPWSSWLIAATPEFCSAKAPDLKKFLSNLSNLIYLFDSPESRQADSREFVAKHFNYPEDDVAAWLTQVTYPKRGVDFVETKTITETLRILEQAGILQQPQEGWDLEDFVATRIAALE